MEPGEQSWINADVQGVVASVMAKRGQSGKTFYPTVLRDENGSAEISFALFTAPKYGTGDVILLTGGLRRDVYDGRPQIKTGKSTQIHVIRKGTGGGGFSPSPAGGGAPSRAAGEQGALPLGSPQFSGASVGGAMNQAIDLCRADADPLSREWWLKVHKVASVYLRVYRTLEAGTLAHPLADGLKEEAPDPASESTGGRASPPPRASRPVPGPDGSAFPPSPDDEEGVPF